MESNSNDVRIKKKMTIGALYTDALKWYNDTSNVENSPPAKATENKLKDISLELSEPEDASTDSETDFHETESVDLHFSFALAFEVWQTMEPVPKQYDRHDSTHTTKLRTYHVLEPGLWTNILAEKIAEHRKKIICTRSFKRAKVYMNGEKYVTISAICTTCRASLVGYVADKPKEGEKVKFSFNVVNFNEEAHRAGRKNVRISGKRAKDLFESKEIASVLRRNEITESGAEMFEQPKGRDVTENAIRCGQYRHRQSKKLSDSPIQAVEYLKESNLYGPSIHWISTMPFSVMYGSPNQFILHDAYRKHNSYRKLCLDGTGGLVHKLSNQ